MLKLDFFNLSLDDKNKIIQFLFFMLAFLFYFERHLNFSVYFSKNIVLQFGDKTLLGLFKTFSLDSILYIVKVLDGGFLIALLYSSTFRFNIFLGFYIYLFNLFLFYLNPSFSYGIDIFLQLGFTYYVFKHFSSNQPAKKRIPFLRYYFSMNYLFAAIHKIINEHHSPTTFVDTISKVQESNNAYHLFLLKNYSHIFSYDTRPFLAVLIIGLFILTSLSLFFNYKAQQALILLIGFHLLSIPIMNVYIMPTIIVLFLITIYFNEIPKDPQTD